MNKILENIIAYEDLIEGSSNTILKGFKGRGKYNKYNPWVFIVYDKYKEIGEDVYKKIIKIDSFAKLNPYSKEDGEILRKMILRTHFNTSLLYMLAILIPKTVKDDDIESLLDNEEFLDILKIKGLEIARQR